MGSVVTLVIGFGALSVDVSLITMAKLQAQATADGAAHAALITYEQNKSTSAGVTAAQFIVDHDTVAMGLGKLGANFDGQASPEYGNWNFDPRVLAFQGKADEQGNFNAVRVTVNRNSASSNAVNLLLAPILGIPTADVSATSIAAQEQRAIMVVNDVSCSMMENNAFAVTQLRDGDNEFLDFLVDHHQAGDKLGLAMFARFGTIIAGPTGPYRTGTESDAPWIPLQDILLPPNGDNRQLFKSGINGVCDTLSATPCGGADPHPLEGDIGDCTNPAIAFSQAVNELVNKTGAPYFRGIVFESDGLPNCDVNGPISDAQARANALAVVRDAFQKDDIQVWTILYHNGGFNPQFMKDMAQGIGFFQDSPDSTQLSEMFRQVAESLPTAFVF
jgi:hypothetical protein